MMWCGLIISSLGQRTPAPVYPLPPLAHTPQAPALSFLPGCRELRGLLLLRPPQLRTLGGSGRRESLSSLLTDGGGSRVSPRVAQVGWSWLLPARCGECLVLPRGLIENGADTRWQHIVKAVNRGEYADQLVILPPGT